MISILSLAPVVYFFSHFEHVVGSRLATDSTKRIATICQSWRRHLGPIVVFPIYICSHLESIFLSNLCALDYSIPSFTKFLFRNNQSLPKEKKIIKDTTFAKIHISFHIFIFSSLFLHQAPCFLFVSVALATSP